MSHTSLVNEDICLLSSEQIDAVSGGTTNFWSSVMLGVAAAVCKEKGTSSLECQVGVGAATTRNVQETSGLPQM